MKKWSQKLGSKLKRDKLKKEESHLAERGSSQCVPDESNQASDTLKPSAIDVSSEILDSSLQAARQALVYTRTVTGKHLEHENKPGYYGQVALSVVNRLSVFTNSVKKFADVITDTQGVDQSILDLFETLDSVYEFIEDTTEIKIHPSYERIITSLAQQTVECAYFIRDYANKKIFWIRAARNAIGEPIKSRVQSYQGAFKNLLEEFQTQPPYASGAGLSTRKKCLPGTRVEVLDEIIEWINDMDENCPRLFWLAGQAGVGKSAIAHSIALRFKSIRRLGSFFCFDRNQSVDGRREKIFSTIARDLASLDSQIKHELAKAIKNEISLCKTPDLQLEWEKFVLEPLRITSQISTGPILVVIDALDESGDPSSRRELLKILEKETSSLPVNIRFLVTSRPEKDITLTFNKSHIRTKTMNTIPENETNRDILSYFKTTLEAEITDGFFTNAHLKRLVDLSQGLFQWAFLASQYLIGIGNSAGLIPTERYEKLLNLNTQNIRLINGPLDVMYNQILSYLFDSDDPQVMDRFRSVIGSIVTASEPLSLKNLIALRGEDISMSRRETDIKVVIQYMGSLLSGTNDPSSPIRPLHLSFREYLLDESRSGNFWINPSDHHRGFAFGCLRIMSSELRFNICDISNSHIRNIDDEGLPERILSSISSQLSYSSRFWTVHVSSTAFDSLLAERVEKFFHDYFLLWLEVLSLLKAVGGAAKSMSNLISWCSECHETLYNFSIEGKRFVQLFCTAIAESAPHIYLSTLPFCPQDSIIYKTFIDRFRNIFRIASEPLQGWPLGRRRIDGMTDIQCASFSHGGQYLAVGLAGKSNLVKVLDSETLKIIWVMETEPQPHTRFVDTVRFSTGDKSLVFAILTDDSATWTDDSATSTDDSATSTNIYSFDILTGVKILQTRFPRGTSIKLSEDARFVALYLDEGLFIVQNLETKEEVIKIKIKHAPDHCYEFSNTDDDVFFAYLNKDIGPQLWSLETDAVLRRLQPPSPDLLDESRLRVYHIFLNGQRIIFNISDSIYIWNLRDNSLITLQGYESIQNFTMTPSRDCISIKLVNQLILHDMSEGIELRCETAISVFPGNLFSKDEKRLVVFESEYLDVWDIDGWRSFAPTHHSKSLPPYPLSPVVSLDGKYFLAGTLESRYHEIWDFESRQRIRTLTHTSSNRGNDPLRPGMFSSMNRYFGYVSDKRNVMVYDIHSETTKNISLVVEVQSIAFSQDETLLAILGVSGEAVYIWNIDSPAIIDVLNIPKSPRPEYFTKFKASSTFRYFAYTTFPSDIILFDGTQLIPLDYLTHGSNWDDFVFSLDEERMLISRGSKIFHINLITAEYQVVTLQGNPFTPGQRSIFFTSNSEALLFKKSTYRAEPEYCICLIWPTSSFPLPGIPR
ncbi:hypothetical protein Clacol_004948 [Clathrus columnatus]|uniref:NACHT domain-containing protein n=1 Tax=Clathrus columnatus TaxID=1419009 RepID=A0AAV5ACI0_9AGAM|nr:hypothetical protein Clacol_004948 [Clathrus columnatus]